MVSCALGFSASVGGRSLAHHAGPAARSTAALALPTRADATASEDGGSETAPAVAKLALKNMSRRGALAAAVGTALAARVGVARAAERVGYNAGTFGETNNDSQLLEYNRRIQELNKAPKDFPAFIREGYDVRVLVEDDWVREKNGLIYKDFAVGEGVKPVDGQEVIFEYTAYNESGGRIDSTATKGRPANTQLGIGGLIPGFEAGLKTMRPGGKRRIIVPPELGPPTGPSTFFSAKQFEVFDVELLQVRNCKRQQVAMFSSVVCEDIIP